MTARESIAAIFEESGLVASAMGTALAHNALDTIMQTTPEETIDAGFYHFMRVYESGGQPAFELSLLTKDGVVHDLAYTAAEQETIFVRFTQNTRVHLQTYSTQSEPHRRLEAYRAELQILNGNSGVRCSAEGKRSQVEALTSYGYACLRMLQELSRREECGDG